MMGLDSVKQRAGTEQSAPQRTVLAAVPVPVPVQARLRWHSRRWLRTMGWPAVLAIGLLVVCLSLYFSTIRPMQERLVEVQHSTVVAREQALRDGQAGNDRLLTPAEQLAEFYRAFPAERYSPQWLEKLIAIAEQNDLSLNEGEYKTSREKVGRLVRYQIVLPVKGQYPQIREFLAEIPAEIPIMALENVQFERENVADATVTAKIKLVLYLEQAS